MAELSFWTDIFPALGIGTILAGLITAFANYMIKEREYYIDIAKDKLVAISKLKPYVVQLARYYNLLSRQLTYGLSSLNDLDYHLCMYIFCNILTLNRKIFEEFGGIQLDDLEAEIIIGKYRDNVTAILRGDFTNEEMYRLADILGTKNGRLTYNQFLESISKPSSNKYLYNKFEEWIRKNWKEKEEKDKQSEDKIRQLIKDTTIASALLSLEINQTYEMWYKHGPSRKNFKNFKTFEENYRHIKQDLQSEYPSYFCRISEFDFTRKRKIFKRIFRV